MAKNHFQMSDEEESKRVSIQVSSLSTQLIESIDKQSKLEEQLHHAMKVISGQKESLLVHEVTDKELRDAKAQLEMNRTQIDEYKKNLTAEKAARKKAEDDVDRLNKEVEDLTASLFDEANKMVADARKETHSIEVKNAKLIEQLHEKDNLLDTLSIQLKNLKKVLYNLDSESSSIAPTNKTSGSSDNVTSSNVSIEKTITTTNSVNEYNLPSNCAVFSPILPSLRYDLTLYNEFLKFIAVLPLCSSIKETTSHSKLLKRLVHDEIQPILRLDNASGLGWFVRRNLMSLMIEGLVVVEPLSGINETYRVGYSSPRLGDSTVLQGEKDSDSHLYNYPVNSPPIAIQAPCAFCSESRNDILEHGRLYVLRTQQKNEDGTIETASEFPLCHYCLLKIRQTCEIFAFLRTLKSGVWNLEKLNLKTISQDSTGLFKEVKKTTAPDRVKANKKSNRMSFMTGLSNPLVSKPSFQLEVPNFSNQNGQPTTNIQRAWVQLSKLRSSLNWAHIGVWSMDDAVSLKVGPVDEEAASLHESTDSNSALFQNVQKLNESFTLEPEVDVDKEAFDFEKGNDTIETIKAEDQTQPKESNKNDTITSTNFAESSESKLEEQPSASVETTSLDPKIINIKSGQPHKATHRVNEAFEAFQMSVGDVSTFSDEYSSHNQDAEEVARKISNDEEVNESIKSTDNEEPSGSLKVSGASSEVHDNAESLKTNTLSKHESEVEDSVHLDKSDGDYTAEDEASNQGQKNSSGELKSQSNTDDDENLFDDALSTVSNS